MMSIDAQTAQLPLVLALLAAPIGAFDVLWFHIRTFRLYEVPSSRTETMIHLVRGAVFSSAVFLLANYRFEGFWFWLIGALFVADLTVNVLDVLVEPGSRAPLGGIPRAEYLLHVVGSMFSGAVAATYFVTGWTGHTLPTALIPLEEAFPSWLRWQGNMVATSGALLTLVEGFLFCTSRTVPTRSLAS
jgi:hypothetical protein